MYDEPESPDKPVMKRARDVTTILTVVMLFAPNMISIYSSEWFREIWIRSVLWVFWPINGHSMPPSYFPVAILTYLPLHIPRFAFVYWVYRYYVGKTTRKRALIVGVISETWWWIPSIPTMLMLIIYPSFYIQLPIPILFLLGLVIMKRMPTLAVYEPWEDIQEERDWWEKPTEKKEKEETKAEPSPPQEDEPW